MLAASPNRVIDILMAGRPTVSAYAVRRAWLKAQTAKSMGIIRGRIVGSLAPVTYGDVLRRNQAGSTILLRNTRRRGDEIARSMTSRAQASDAIALIILEPSWPLSLEKPTKAYRSPRALMNRRPDDAGDVGEINGPAVAAPLRGRQNDARRTLRRCVMRIMPAGGINFIKARRPSMRENRQRPV